MRTALAFLLVLLAGGCGGGDDEAGDGGGTTTAAQADIEVFASEFAFAPPFVIIEKGAGTYTLSLRNDGSVPHNLTIKGVGATKNVEPGETEVITITVESKAYPIVCTLHESEGMDGELVVNEPPS